MFNHSNSCGIEDKEENTIIITGGDESGSITRRVVKYHRNGNYENLPSLNTARRLHGCGSYRNNNQQKVDIVSLKSDSI